MPRRPTPRPELAVRRRRTRNERTGIEMSCRMSVLAFAFLAMLPAACQSPEDHAAAVRRAQDGDRFRSEPSSGQFVSACPAPMLWAFWARPTWSRPTTKETRRGCTIRFRRKPYIPGEKHGRKAPRATSQEFSAKRLYDRTCRFDITLHRLRVFDRRTRQQRRRSCFSPSGH